MSRRLLVQLSTMAYPSVLIYTRRRVEKKLPLLQCGQWLDTAVVFFSVWADYYCYGGLPVRKHFYAMPACSPTVNVLFICVKCFPLPTVFIRMQIILISWNKKKRVISLVHGIRNWFKNILNHFNLRHKTILETTITMNKEIEIIVLYY